MSQQLRAALSAMLTHMGMDEDEYNKGVFDQARAALAADREVPLSNDQNRRLLEVFNAARNGSDRPSGTLRGIKAVMALAAHERCEVPPPGWTCSRDKGHDGPCAARSVPKSRLSRLMHWVMTPVRNVANRSDQEIEDEAR